MKYVFFGTPEFAAIILEKLIKAGLPPAEVVCNPDRTAGRQQTTNPPPTKVLAKKYGIPVWQPEKLDVGNWKLEIEKLGGIEFAIVAAYAKIIHKEMLDTLPGKFLGVHPSLLPKYRGSTPIQTAILSGEKETGTTIFLMDEKVDHGAILAQREFQITNYKLPITYTYLLKKLAELSADLLIATLPKFTRGEIKPTIQNEAEATYTKKFRTQDGYIDLAKDDPTLIERKIRALNPEPGVWTIKNRKRVKILDDRTIQFEGKKPVKVPSAIDFLKPL